MISRYAIYDNFLDEEQATNLLQHAYSNKAQFFRPSLPDNNNTPIDYHIRNATHISDSDAPPYAPFKDMMHAHFAQFCEQTGIGPFDFSHLEVVMAAHRDGAYFKRHIDTFRKNTDTQTDRIISAVYYFSRQPQIFSGGQLSMQSMTENGEELIEPVHNRLVVFPSFAPHEVLELSVPGDRFEDARFSLACWFHRARQK